MQTRTLAGHTGEVDSVVVMPDGKRIVRKEQMLDENQNIISVTQGNIYFISGKKLVTPKLDRCGVIGSRRSLILELAKSMELNVKEDTISINEVRNADEVFISNSIIGIQSVSSIEDYYLPKSRMTEKIKKAFESLTQDIKSWTCI